MKKAILVILGLFLFSGWAYAQVVVDFEKDAGGYSDNGWGPLFISVQKVADPTGKSTGVLELNADGTRGDKGVIQKDNFDMKKAAVLTYWIWLPKDTPDGIQISTWAQDNKNWSWQAFDNDSKNIPKEVWYPISFYLDQRRLSDATFDGYNNLLGKTGIQFYMGGAANKSWKGKILVDNVTLVGVEPKSIADFESTDYGFKKLWGSVTSITKIADPTPAKTKGVIEIKFNGPVDKDGAFGSENATDAAKGNILVLWIWLPKGAPDDLFFKVFAQDNKDWAWNESDYTGKAIPKEVWFPLYFNMAAVRSTPGSKFDNVANKIGKFGIEVVHSAWNGTFYIDNVSYLGIETGAKWIVNNFDAAAGGVQGWTTWFGQALTGLARTDKDGTGVLKASFDFSKESKGAMQKGNLSIYSNVLKQAATDVTFDVFLPADIPLGGQVGLVVNGPEGGWNEAPFAIKDKADSSGIERGKWQTIRFNLTQAIKDGKIADPTKNVTVGVQVYHASANNYKGDIYFDNLTVLGIPEPQGTVVSPKTTGVSASYKTQAGNTYNMIRFDWIDNTIGTETYNIYRSEKPITDLKAAGVVKIIGGIPHGMQKYGHRPWTPDGVTKTYYFAVTAFDGINETPLTNDCKVGPITIQTTKAFTLQYVKDFSKKFVLDGLDNEFVPYKANQIIPESAGGKRGPAWDLTSKDMNFKTTLVVDDKYLYISAEVTDDDIRNDPTAQAWQGDALEFYLGFYDVRLLKETHAKNSTQSNGDWRIGFLSSGKTTLQGTDPINIKGVKATVFQKFTGDGYIIEAQIELDSMAINNKFGALSGGMMLPCRIDGNDWDTSKGDTERGLIIQAGGMPTNQEVPLDEDWKRPDAWGYLNVVGLPNGIAGESTLPTEYALYNNYPNPFNPTTIIKYDLPEESQVSLKVYDVLGREVASLVDQKQAAGSYKVNFNASRLSSGVYFYRISAGTFVVTKKLMLMK